MKTKFLSKLRDRGRRSIRIYSVTEQGGRIVGMSYSYDNDAYANLFSLGDTEEDVREKAARVYVKLYMKKYGKR